MRASTAADDVLDAWLRSLVRDSLMLTVSSTGITISHASRFSEYHERGTVRIPKCLKRMNHDQIRRHA